jgi:hypothetical protein
MAKISMKGMPMPMMKKEEEEEMDLEGMPELEDMPEEDAEVEVEVKPGQGPDLSKLPDEAIIEEMRKRGLLDEEMPA